MAHSMIGVGPATLLQVWYGVPAHASEALEEAMADALPHLFDTAPNLIYQLVRPSPFGSLTAINGRCDAPHSRRSAQGACLLSAISPGCACPSGTSHVKRLNVQLRA